jgi:cysteinyl-tRNA synthetase
VASDTLRELAQVLGLSLQRLGVTARLVPALQAVLADVRTHAAELFPDPASTGDPEQLIRTLLAGRERARARRAYDVADRVRTRLGELGILVEDLPTGPRWRMASSDGRQTPSDARQPRP